MRLQRQRRVDAGNPEDPLITDMNLSSEERDVLFGDATYVKLTDMGFAKQVTEDPRRGHEDMKIKTPAVCASHLKRFKLGAPRFQILVI